MIIYTNLKKTNPIFPLLEFIANNYGINLKYGLLNSDDYENIVVFWFAKSNKRLTYYRVKESLESIYKSLEVLEKHRELI